MECQGECGRPKKDAAKAIIVHHDAVLMLRLAQAEQDAKGQGEQYEPPGGLRDDVREPLTTTAQRETREETGLEIMVGDEIATSQWHATDGGAASDGLKVHIIGHYLRCVLALGSSTIDVRLSSEHDGSVWMTESDLAASPPRYPVHEDARQAALVALRQ